MTEHAGPSLTTVMYHYVRPLASSSHPDIKGLDLERFRGQVHHLLRHHTPVGIDDVIASARGGPPLPVRPVLLTFDDGYVDHVRHVFPILHELGVPGAFFASSGAVLGRRLLDVNKVHFVLASGRPVTELIELLEAAVAVARVDHDLPTIEELRTTHAVANRFDPAPVIYLKRMLQHALPEDLRAAIVDDLFARFVSRDEAAFADDLYVGVDDLARMADAGMHVGVHGHRHAWLDRMDAAEQADDIDRSLTLLDAIGRDRRDFTFCYPYGGYTAETVELLRQRGCAAAFTTVVGLAPLPLEDLLELPRLDTNDLPFDAAAPPSGWTLRASTTGGAR